MAIYKEILLIPCIYYPAVLTLDFALLMEPCQSFVSIVATGNFGLGGRLEYHFTNTKNIRPKAAWNR
jgi:hypothetical protein